MNTLTETDAETVRQLYRAGLSQAAIGAELGVSQMAVSRFMRRQGMLTRPPGPSPDYNRIGYMRRMAEAGMTQRAMAAILGISQSSVRDAMARYGIRRARRAGAAPDASPSASTTPHNTRHSETEPDLHPSQVQS
ncbi:sigma factor-like helix-turn-helix DNA-binding protein [Amaricoccus sp. W119]|uniref:sigma factor-like helix-turn-helix DNA-binding protein n=1 Tax=Amaricoccus sp. W119 TaxID=3391833 RepID=UPI0039A4C5CA